MPGLGEREFREISRQFLRAVRGDRSQVAFSRRVGFSSNVAAEWESGRRVPALSTVLSVCAKCGVDLGAAFARFWPPSQPLLGQLESVDLARWLDAQRGKEKISAVARHAGMSRAQTTRILTAETEPRLHQFFALVQAITGRLSDLVAECVDVQLIDALRDHDQRVLLSRRLAYDEPWTSALLSAIECLATVTREEVEERLAEVFELPLTQVRDYLQHLVLAGLVARRRRRYVLGDPMVVDTGARTESARRLVRHWAQLGADRVERMRSLDMYSYNVFSLSQEDFATIAQMQREHFQRVRAIVAKSSPEMVAVMNLQLLEFDLRQLKDDGHRRQVAVERSRTSGVPGG
jgi:AraC-like DNA-binding protein